MGTIMGYYLRSQAAKIAKINIETLIFYEKNGLIPAPDRTKSGYRLYHDSLLERLEFIKQAKEAGFTLDEIKKTVSIAELKDSANSAIIDLIHRKIEEIDLRISRLEQMKGVLEQVDENLKGGKGCPVISSLLSNFETEKST